MGPQNPQVENHWHRYLFLSLFGKYLGVKHMMGTCLTLDIILGATFQTLFQSVLDPCQHRSSSVCSVVAILMVCDVCLSIFWVGHSYHSSSEMSF